MKKIFAFVLALVMLLSLSPSLARSAEANAPVSSQSRDAANLNEALNVPGGSLAFETDSEYPWVVSGDAAKSTNEGVSNSTSSVWTTVSASAGDVLSFDYMSCGEGTYEDFDWDGLRVYVDGEKVLHRGYEHVWSSFTCALEAGEHLITFTYKKDDSYDAEGDCAYLDNVYVGPQNLPQRIEVSPLEIPQGRMAYAEYTVLPEDAFDKSVTFSTANPAVASVDEAGVVTAVSLGSTLLTVTSAADPSVSGSALITVAPAVPTARLEGYVTLDISESGQGSWIGIESYEPSIISTNAENMPDTWAGAFAGGNIYGYLAENNGQDRRYYIMNADTFEMSFPGAVSPDIVYAMAYDHRAGRMFAIVGQGARYLAEVELETGSMTEIGTITGVSGKPMTMAIDLNGNAYVLGGDANNSRLYRMNTETAVCTLIGGTGLGMNYVQSMAFDNETGLLYWARVLHQESFGLYSIDPANAQARPLGEIGGRFMEITCMFIRNDLPLGPIEQEGHIVRFVDGVDSALIGSITVEDGYALSQADYPQPPAHAGREFLGWDYDGAPIHSDITVTALYGDEDPNPPVVTAVWDFETNPAQQGFAAMDADGDGHNWMWRYGDNWTYIFHEGLGHVASASFDGETLQPLTPDNWLITPEFTGSRISFWANGQDTDYCREYIGVFVSTDGGNTWSSEIAGWTVTGAPTKYTADLSQFAGQRIRVALRHYIVSDMYWLNLDYIEVYSSQQSGLLGDADLNGEVTLADAVIALRHAMGLAPISGQALINADVNRDGEVNLGDSVLILRASMGLITLE